MIRRPRNLSGLMTSSSVAMASSLLGVGQAGGGGDDTPTFLTLVDLIGSRPTGYWDDILTEAQATTAISALQAARVLVTPESPVFTDVGGTTPAVAGDLLARVDSIGTLSDYFSLVTDGVVSRGQSGGYKWLDLDVFGLSAGATLRGALQNVSAGAIWWAGHVKTRADGVFNASASFASLVNFSVGTGVASRGLLALGTSAIGTSDAPFLATRRADAEGSSIRLDATAVRREPVSLVASWTYGGAGSVEDGSSLVSSGSYQTAGSSSNTASQVGHIGNNTAASTYGGTAHVVGIWGRALTTDEKTALNIIGEALAPEATPMDAVSETFEAAYARHSNAILIDFTAQTVKTKTAGVEATQTTDAAFGITGGAAYSSNGYELAAAGTAAMAIPAALQASGAIATLFVEMQTTDVRRGSDEVLAGIYKADNTGNLVKKSTVVYSGATNHPARLIVESTADAEANIFGFDKTYRVSIGGGTTHTNGGHPQTFTHRTGAFTSIRIGGRPTAANPLADPMVYRKLLYIPSAVVGERRITRYRPSLLATTEATLDDLRDEVIAELWKGAGLPSLGLTSRTTVTDALLSPAPANLNQTEDITIAMDDGVGGTYTTSSGRIWHPTPGTANGHVAFYLGGHGNLSDTLSIGVDGGRDDFITELVEAGYVTVFLEMPFVTAGDNVLAHNNQPDATAGLNPMRYFVEPCIRIINELETPGRKFMVFGFSGGGTTAGLVGGIDTRVTATVPAGGTSAQYMLNNSAPANLRGRDYEEVLWRLRLDHPDFYLMATTGGRPVLQLFNTLDTSAVTVDNFGQYLSYEAQVNSAAQSWGGSFGVEFIARSGHHIDDVMLARVLDFFNAA